MSEPHSATAGTSPFSSLWVKFLLLLIAVVLIGLSATFVLRDLMIQDFRQYLEGAREDRVYWLTTSLETSYARNNGWNRDELMESFIWAAMMGMDVRLKNSGGAVVMDVSDAVDRLPEIVRKRVLAAADTPLTQTVEAGVPYALFLRGQEIGRIEVSFAPLRQEHVFIHRSNRFLQLSVIALGTVALILSLVFAARLTSPIKALTHAASEIATGKLNSRVAVRSRDEIGRLGESFNAMAQTLLVQDSLRKKLTANVAHELRTPLSAVRGELEAMVDGLIPATPQTLASLYDEIGRLRNIIEGIGELTQAEASRLNIEHRTVGLSAFLRSIAGHFDAQALTQGVTLSVDCGETLTVEADPERLSQIIINLIDNALRATSAGGSVRLRAEQSGDAVLITVADTGRGIDARHLPFVFERFYRVAQGVESPDGRQGLGIGLAIVKELVEAHGGAIEVTSTVGAGSTFTVTLPAQSA